MNGDGVSLCDLNRRPGQLPIHHGDQRIIAHVSHTHLAHLQTEFRIPS
jgi:hypothetical protein